MKRFNIINTLIKKFDYENYLEIGTANRSWNFDKIKINNKVCVDPDPETKADFIMESDKFFEQNNKKYDIIFIDGLHEWHQVNRDIKNSLEILNNGGAIIIHDCSPKSERAATPWGNLMLEHSSDIDFAWNGDVYKAFIEYKYTSPNKDNTINFTVNADHGCGIILNRNDIDLINNKSKKIQLTNMDIVNMDYLEFAKNRRQYLTLITQSQFNNLFQV